MVALSKATNAFLTWTTSVGIQTPFIELAERPNGRYYVTCRQDMEAGQDLVCCPLNACIVADSLEGETLLYIII